MLIALLFSTFAHAAPGTMKCTAIYQDLVAGKLTEKTTAMPAQIAGDQIRYEAEMEETYYSVNEDLSTGDFILIMSKAPDYERGILSKGKPTADGTLKLSEVNGNKVYQLFCKKL